MKRQGIALISALLILVALMALGTSALRITNLNLKSAESARSQTMAKGNAESGLDAAYILLTDAFLASSMSVENRTFPSSFSLASTSTYQLSSYNRLSPTQAQVKVKGSTLSGGEYLSEALIIASPGTPTIPPVYSKGLVSEGLVRVNGGASLYIDSSVHGNSGFWLGGDFQICDTRDSSGNCTSYDPASILDPDLPVSLSSATGTCRVRNRNCTATNYMAEAITVSPNYIGRRNKAAGLDDSNNNGVIDVPAECPAGFSNAVPGVISNNAKICANAAVTLSNATLSGATIISNGNITVNGNFTCNDVTLISLTGTVNLNNTGTANLTGCRIFSQGALNLSTKTATWNGQNTLATAGTITFNGSNKHNNTVNAITNSDGSISIGLALIAEGNITFNGRNNAAQNYWASFITGGTFTQNGRSDFFGTISAKNNLTFNGNLTIDSGLDLVNDDLMEESAPSIDISSRR